MAYNLGTVRSRVEQKLDDTNFGAAKLNQFINDAQRDILNSRRFTFMEREADLQTVIGSSSVTGTPTDLQIPITLRMFSPTNYASMMTYMEYEDFDDTIPNQALVGDTIPQYWRVFNGEILVYPNSDALYDMKLKYIKTPTELVADADVPEVPEAFGELLVLGAYKRALEYNDDYDQAQVIQQQVDVQMDMLDQRSKRQTGLPHVMRQPWQRRRSIGGRLGGI